MRFQIELDALFERLGTEVKEGIHRAARFPGMPAPPGHPGISEADRIAARNGDPVAQCNLGTAYFTEGGVPLDISQAKTWLTRAAIQGHVTAQYNLGVVYYEEGRDIEAYTYFNMAAKADDQDAKSALKVLKEDLSRQDRKLAKEIAKEKEKEFRLAAVQNVNCVY